VFGKICQKRNKHKRRKMCPCHEDWPTALPTLIESTRMEINDDHDGNITAASPEELNTIEQLSNFLFVLSNRESHVPEETSAARREDVVPNSVRSVSS
jgi:hypothetical protein